MKDPKWKAAMLEEMNALEKNKTWELVDLPHAALAGVFIRTGSVIATGERVVSGLVQRLGALDYVSDNAGDFRTGAFPRNGIFINFGVHRVYVSTVPANRYPDVVHVAADPPAVLAARGRCTAHPTSCEVMMAGTGAEASKEAGAENHAPAKSARPSKPGYERAENLAAQIGTSSAPNPNPLQAAIEQLNVPVTSAADIALAREQLEEQRLSILHEANEIARVRQELDITLREYNTAQGLANVAEPSRVHIRLRGKNLNKEIARNGRAESSMSATHISAPKPVYSTPAKNLRAAQAAAVELQHLTSDALRKQQARVKELVDIANMQNAECAKANPGAGASQVVHSTRGVPGKSKGQASSPHVGDKRAGSVNSKQMALYDPVEAGKRVAEQGNPNVGNNNVGRNSQAADRGHVGVRPQGRHRANSAGGHAPRYPARSQDRHDDGDTAMMNAGYRRLDQARHAEPLGDRLGARHLPAYDARHRLDRIYLTEQLEVQGPPGPACFGLRIMREEPPVRNFQLPRDTRTYDGSTKPEDWLIDYATAVYVAGGNRRWAVRFVPSVLVGPARIWLNNLPAGSIDGWIDFEEEFVSNFSSTYKMPNRPQQLSLCQQRENETDREYLTRWSAMRNSCEGIIEAQAISWFANGCRRGSMLWQRLQRDMPVTLADMIRIADSYALGDPTQPAFTTDMQPRPPPSRPDFRNSNNNHGHKIREDFPDRRYGPQLVAAVTPDQPEAGNSQRQKTGGQQWNGQKKPWGDKKQHWQEKPKYTYEMMLDQPCSFHTLNPSKPANHTTRQCSWMNRLRQDEAGKNVPLPPPPPLIGANTQVMLAQPTYPPNQDGQEGVHQVNHNNNPNVVLGRNQYTREDQAYVVFVTEPTDRQSVQRRSMEVNAVMPAIPEFMYWSEQQITWDQRDHPKVMPKPGAYALVVDPIIIGPSLKVRFSKVLVDNGSSINIIYKDTLVKLGINENQLESSRTTFHGIVPGVSCAPMGRVRVDVLFGTKENSRVENILFEVVDLSSPYHALLGRPALAQFMASTHVSYLKMKIPGPYGLITITGNYKKSMECSSTGSALAESLVIAEEKKRMMQVVAMAQAIHLGMPSMSNPMGVTTFKPSTETKAIQLDEAHPERTVLIEAKPVKQPLRWFAEDRRTVIRDEVAKLLAAGFIMEVLYPDCHPLGALDYVSDNAGDFRTGAFPRNGIFINFGVHRVYVSTVPANRYPDVVHVAADPPAVLAARGRCTARPTSCEVMMAGTGAEASKEAGAENHAPAKSARPSKPGYERAENLAAQISTSSAPNPNPLQAAIEQLNVPVTSAADIALAREQLEEQRLSILHEANEIARVRQELDITLREYNTAQGLANVAEPSRVHIRLRVLLLKTLEQLRQQQSSYSI
ncbi:hypothetical protein ACQ4PT_007916 [Festuca glaucescens]